MCYMFITTYDACHHFGQPEYRPCGISHCTNITSSRGSDEMEDFCPECFLRHDFEQNLQQPWTYDVYLIMSVISCTWSSARKQAETFYERAAKFHKEKPGTNDMLALVPSGAGKLGKARRRITYEILKLLLRDFWVRVKYNLAPQPTLSERMLIVQLFKVREFEGIKLRIEKLQRKTTSLWTLTTIVPDAEIAATDFCYICHGPFATVNEDGTIEHCVKTNLCNHIFGNVCLEAWWSATKDDWTCPTCRRQLVPGISIADETAIENDGARGRVKFTTPMLGHPVQIRKVGTPEWMVTLLGAIDAEDGDNSLLI